MPNLFSDIVGNAALWTRPDPPHADDLTAYGSAAGATNLVVKAGLAGLATTSPTVVAFMMAGDKDNIYLGYQPTLYPTDVSNATAFDKRVVLLVGNNLDSAVTVCIAEPPSAGWPRLLPTIMATTRVLWAH